MWKMERNEFVEHIKNILNQFGLLQKNNEEYGGVIKKEGRVEQDFEVGPVYSCQEFCHLGFFMFMPLLIGPSHQFSIYHYSFVYTAILPEIFIGKFNTKQSHMNFEQFQECTSFFIKLVKVLNQSYVHQFILQSIIVFLSFKNIFMVKNHGLNY